MSLYEDVAALVPVLVDQADRAWEKEQDLLERSTRAQAGARAVLEPSPVPPVDRAAVAAALARAEAACVEALARFRAGAEREIDGFLHPIAAAPDPLSASGATRLKRHVDARGAGGWLDRVTFDPSSRIAVAEEPLARLPVAARRSASQSFVAIKLGHVARYQHALYQRVSELRGALWSRLAAMHEQLYDLERAACKGMMAKEHVDIAYVEVERIYREIVAANRAAGWSYGRLGNMGVNSGLGAGLGLCNHWADHIHAQLVTLGRMPPQLKATRVVRDDESRPLRHVALLVYPLDRPPEEGVVLDPWFDGTPQTFPFREWRRGGTVFVDLDRTRPWYVRQVAS